MKIMVCLKEVVDTALNLDTGLKNRRVFQEGLPLRLNPPDVQALAMALGKKSSTASQDVNVTVISIGPERVERYLRQALALGAERTVRIWQNDLVGLSPYLKTTILNAFASLDRPDLILTGAGSLDTANGQVGPLLAARLGLPCVSGVVKLENENGSLKITRDIGRGKREILESSLPAVLTVKEQEAILPQASVDSLIESTQADIEVMSLLDLNLSPAELKEEPTRITGLMMPRPRPHKVPTPSSSLPAFDRILKLLEGGIKRRRGKMLEGNTEELTQQLYELLITEGVIKPAAE